MPNVEKQVKELFPLSEENKQKHLNPHMHKIFLKRYCMEWVPGDPLKEMIN